MPLHTSSLLHYSKYIGFSIDCFVQSLVKCYNFAAGDEDDQFEEEREMIIKEIERLSRLSNLGS